MTKRLSSKLLAVILTIAICATTVLGCLIAASAADSCYAFGVATFAEDDLTQATMDVTFTKNDTVPYGFSAGAFTVTEVDADSEDYLVVKSVVAAADGINLTNEGDYYIFDSEDVFDSVTFTLTFGFSQGEASEGTTYKVKLTDVELAHSNDAHFEQDDSNGAIGEITTSCNHSVTVVGDPVATGVGGDYGYSVYEQSVCVLCGEQFGYQLVPTAESLNDSDVVLPTEEDTFAGRTELAVKYDQAGDASNDATDSSNWVLDVEGTPHRTWGYIDADIKLLDETQENSEENPYIIESAEQLFYIVKIGGSKTAGKYYKVKDGIRAFHLNPNVTDETSFEDMMANIGNSGANWDAAAAFQGHFDGNGVIITGIRTTTNHAYAGLFPQVAGNVTIKNVTIMNSYIVGKTAVGAVFGSHIYDSTAGVVYDVTVENCAVYQCYMQSTGTTGVGAIGGYVANTCNPGTGWINGNTVINNCYINLDEDYFISATETSGTGSHGGAVGYQGSSVMNVTNSIFIGIRPYTARNLTGDKMSGNYGWQGSKSSCYNNVYTTHACDDAYNSSGTLQDFTGRIFTLSDSQFKGKDADLNMLTLDWETVWATTTGYPTLYMPYNRPEAPTNIIYWDGTVATGIAEGSGTKDDPYIINTAAELAYLVGLDGDAPETPVTKGKYYKVADGIDTIVLQSKDKARPIMALDSASAVKSYFESGTFTEWVEKGWEKSSFCGTFDGNGATVYGLYIVSAYNAGLFSTVDAGATIKNIAVKNSYIVSQSSGANYQIGAIAAVASGDSYGVKDQGAFWFNNCTVANCYMYNNCTGERSGVIFGNANYDIACIDNCLVYGNDATYGDGLVMGLTGLSKNNLEAEGALLPEGLTTVLNGIYLNPMVRNSIVLGSNVMNVNTGYGYRKNSPDCYVNVYTDGASGTVNFTSGSWTYTDEQIKGISAADAQGPTANTVLTGLAWNTDWFVGGEGEYPAQSVFVTPGVANASNADFEVVGTNIVYEDDGSFSLNIHYIPAYTGFTPTMYVGDTNCTKLYVLQDPVASSKRDDIGDDTAMMFTLSGISAKNIDKLWHPTLVAQQGASIDWSQSAQISVAENATAIIEGDYDTADKNVASAVLLYGDASQAALAVTSSDYSAGVIDLLEFGSYLTDMGSSSQYYDTVVADNGETGDSWDDPIIIDSAEELVYLCKGSGNETAGKYYKVADGIAGFNLSNKNLDINKSYEANESVITNSGKNHSGGTPGFQGNFDGNGATVYGANINSSTYAGLFSCTKGDVTIKNINVKLSRFVGTTAAGGIVGYHEMTKNLTQAKNETTSSGALVLPVNGSLTIENCSVTECYIESKGTTYGSGVGAILGYESNSWADSNITYASGLVDDSALTLGYYDVDGNGANTYYNGEFTINNCYVNLDDDKLVSAYTESNLAVRGGLAGYANTNAGVFKNCIVIGITPYATYKNTANNNHQHTALASRFSNIYTTAATGTVTIGGSVGTNDFTGKVYQLDLAEMTGIAAKQNMTALDWINVWTTTDGYPTFISKDYVAPASGLTIYWDGTTATGISEGSGTKEDPYIINTAAELAYVVSQTPANYNVTDGKYFKVADGISNIVLQDESKVADIMALGSAAETKAYFESESDLLTWKIGSWEATTFCGDIDFNGATVYGIYQVSSYNTGLFSTIDAGAVIRNVAIKNSYMVGNASTANYQVGALAAVSNGDSSGKSVKGVIWFNGITIANNYLYNNSTSGDRSGILMASSSEAVYSDNILIYGNDATYGDGVKMPLIGTAGNSVPDTATVPEDLVTKFAGTNTSGNYLHVCAVRNSILLGTTPYDLTQDNGSRFNDLTNCYENVYTDADLANDAFPNGTSVSGIKGATQVTDLTTLKGDAAQSVVDTFNTANDSTVWYVGTTGDYPGFKEAGALNSGLQALYDGIVLTPDTYNDTGVPLFSMYATSVNLNSNPYMSFAFEFGGELKENRDQITVTFTYTVNGTEYTHTTTPPEFTGDGTINGTDGWYNRPSAGRFHTYRFTGIPVEALANPIKVSANYDGTDYDLGSFSVAGLAYEFECQNKLTPCDYYATRIEAVKALLFYTQMIHARYGAQ